ncbi:MAG: hypothetical protein WCY12_02670 [Candidatus Omnitrophota bacterium]
MGINLGQDWPVYVLLGVVVFFFTCVIINGNKTEKERKGSQAVDKDKK